jgi:hypothetical protein
MSEEMQKVQLKIERKISECQKAISEKNAQESAFKHKDQTIEQLQRQLSQAKEEIRTRDHQAEVNLRLRSDVERTHDQLIKDERERHVRELERLEKKISAEESKNLA